MGRGGRAGREFIDGFQVKTRPERRRQQHRENPKPDHIDLRVIRPASLDDKIPEVGRWESLLSRLGRENHEIGTAYSLGSVTITHVTSTQFNRELSQTEDKKLRKAYFSAKDKPKLFGEMKNQITEFLREQRSTHELAHSEKLRVGASSQDQSNGVLVGNFDTEDCYHHPYEATYFSSPRIGVPIRRRFAIDLSVDNDDILAEEARDIASFVGRKVLKMSTPLQRYVPFHATIFEMHDQIDPKTTLQLGDAVLPEEMFFDRPVVELYRGSK